MGSTLKELYQKKSTGLGLAVSYNTFLSDGIRHFATVNGGTRCEAGWGVFASGSKSHTLVRHTPRWDINHNINLNQRVVEVQVEILSS